MNKESSTEGMQPVLMIPASLPRRYPMPGTGFQYFSVPPYTQAPQPWLPQETWSIASGDAQRLPSQPLIPQPDVHHRLPHPRLVPAVMAASPRPQLGLFENIASNDSNRPQGTLHDTGPSYGYIQAIMASSEALGPGATKIQDAKKANPNHSQTSCRSEDSRITSNNINEVQNKPLSSKAMEVVTGSKDHNPASYKALYTWERPLSSSPKLPDSSGNAITKKCGPQVSQEILKMDETPLSQSDTLLTKEGVYFACKGPSMFDSHIHSGREFSTDTEKENFSSVAKSCTDHCGRIEGLESMSSFSKVSELNPNVKEFIPGKILKSHGSIGSGCIIDGPNSMTLTLPPRPLLLRHRSAFVTPDTCDSQTQTDGALLCSSCQNMLGKDSTSDNSKFVKLKAISVEHKVMYVARQAGVLAREMQDSSKESKLYVKLKSKLAAMCHQFGAEKTEISDWEDDMICQAACDLLAEQAELSDKNNSSKFLSFLKTEVEAKLEIVNYIAQKDLQGLTNISDADMLSDHSRMLAVPDCEMKQCNTKLLVPSKQSTSAAPFRSNRKMSEECHVRPLRTDLGNAGHSEPRSIRVPKLETEQRLAVRPLRPELSNDSTRIDAASFTSSLENSEKADKRNASISSSGTKAAAHVGHTATAVLQPDLVELECQNKLEAAKLLELQQVYIQRLLDLTGQAQQSTGLVGSSFNNSALLTNEIFMPKNLEQNASREDLSTLSSQYFVTNESVNQIQKNDSACSVNGTQAIPQVSKLTLENVAQHNNQQFGTSAVEPATKKIPKCLQKLPPLDLRRSKPGKLAVTQSSMPQSQRKILTPLQRKRMKMRDEANAGEANKEFETVSSSVTALAESHKTGNEEKVNTLAFSITTSESHSECHREQKECSASTSFSGDGTQVNVNNADTGSIGQIIEPFTSSVDFSSLINDINLSSDSFQQQDLFTKLSRTNTIFERDDVSPVLATDPLKENSSVSPSDAFNTIPLHLMSGPSFDPQFTSKHHMHITPAPNLKKADLFPYPSSYMTSNAAGTNQELGPLDQFSTEPCPSGELAPATSESDMSLAVSSVPDVGYQHMVNDLDTIEDIEDIANYLPIEVQRITGSDDQISEAGVSECNADDFAESSQNETMRADTVSLHIEELETSDDDKENQEVSNQISRVNSSGYGLDDISLTDMPMKPKPSESHTASSSTEETEVKPVKLDDGWQKVGKAKKPVKKVVHVDLLQFQAQEKYTNLVTAILTTYKDLLQSEAEEVLETVFMATNKLCGLRLHQIMSEVHMVISEWYPDKMCS